MSELLQRIQALVVDGDFRVSSHGDDEIAADGISIREIIAGVARSTPVAEYPEYGRAPCVLALQWDAAGNPLHVVWGIPKGRERPPVLVTGYRPSPDRWDATFTKRAR